MNHRHENYNASDVLKHLTGCRDMWFEANPWSRSGKHVMLYLLDESNFSYALLVDGFSVLTCDMNPEDTFEVKCKKWLDRCFEVAQDHDIWGKTHSRKHPSHEVMRQGTCLENVLIEIDMSVT